MVAIGGAFGQRQGRPLAGLIPLFYQHTEGQIFQSMAVEGGQELQSCGKKLATPYRSW